jgi:serine palmitoyltransferase
MKIEADIAAFLGTTACIIYAQAFSTISSVIPAFSKRGDIIVADKAVNYAIKKGLQISRSTVRWYEHNDMEDLQRVLAKVTKEQAKKPLTRRFIITEGLFENVGDMVDLPKIVSCTYLHPSMQRLTDPSRSNSSSNTNSASSLTRHGPSAS